MKYNQQLNYQKRKRFLFRVRLFFTGLFLLALLLGAWGYYSIVRMQNTNTEASSTSQQSSGYFAPTVKIFRSPYFQFQANNTWGEVPAESTTTKFVYRSMRSSLIEHELVIYVNQIPDNLASNRVLPVTLAPNGDFTLGDISDHCMKAAGGPKGAPQLVKLDKVTFKCLSDSTNYTVLVGFVDKSTILDLLRPDGTVANYSIYYSNVKATPDGNQLSEILDSFQTR